MALEEQSRIGLGLLAMRVVPGHLPRGAHGVGVECRPGQGIPRLLLSQGEAGCSARLERMKEKPWKGSRKCGCQAEELGLDPLGLAEPLKILDLGAVIETKL